jgi:hypothetical protein
VTVNGVRIRRPLAKYVYPANPEPVVLRGESGDWEAKGILWSPQEIVNPYFLRGVAVRVADVAIGRPSYFNLNELGRVYGKLQHITGEFQLIGFEDLLNLDRQSFRGSTQTDEFLSQITARVTEFENELQKKAAVMQAARNLKKAVERSRTKRKAKKGRRARHKNLADVLVAGQRGRDIADRARDAGIEVIETAGNEIEIPKGERMVRIGRRLGEDLLRIGGGPNEVVVKVVEKGDSMNDSQLADAVLARGKNLVIRGGHPLLADDAWAMSNLRILALLRRATRERILDESQVRWLIKSLRGLYT